jgi:hypothetical protein
MAPTIPGSSSSRNQTLTSASSSASAFKINDFTLNSPFELLAQEFKEKMRELAAKVDHQQRENAS